MNDCVVEMWNKDTNNVTELFHLLEASFQMVQVLYGIM